jgi:hypothetical protein
LRRERHPGVGNRRDDEPEVSRNRGDVPSPLLINPLYPSVGLAQLALSAYPRNACLTPVAGRCSEIPQGIAS